MSTQAIIQLEGIKKIFYTAELETLALNDIHLQVNQGEFVAISGPSGCGKSTLLSLLGLLDTGTEGSYHLAGTNISELNHNERAVIRNRDIGFVFQAFNLISDLTVYENVELPLTYGRGLNKAQRREKVERALHQVDMAHRINHLPSQLSGGQQQRIAIARALVGDPKILLADEPTGNLDSKNADIVLALLDTLHQKGATICMVTHDPRSAEHASRQVVLFDGKVVDDLSRDKTLTGAPAAEASVA